MKLRERLELKRQQLRQRPFGRLVSHFIARLFSGGTGDSAEGEMGMGVGTVLALLASPGGFITIFLFQKYSSLDRFLRGRQNFDPYVASLPDQYFFLTLSFCITGVVTILKWDSIFPDRRDYMNLAPLPLPTRQIFLANLAAILTIAAIFAFDVNAVSAIFFPMLVTMEQPTFMAYEHFALAHVIGVFLASMFVFFALFAVIGTLMVLLPQTFFKRISLFLRVALVTLLLLLLSTSFAVPPLLHSRSDVPAWVCWLPPVWFLEFARSLIGKAEPSAMWLGGYALRVWFSSLAIAAVVYVWSYYRYFIKIPEMLETTAPRRRGSANFFRLLDGWLLRSPAERAIYRFTLKTLLRNDSHAMLAGGFAGLGLVMASHALMSGFAAKLSAIPNVDFLTAPFIMIYFMVCGLRFVFELPAEIRANWLYQVMAQQDCLELVGIARKAILTFVWPWLILAGGLYVRGWGWQTAAAHTLLSLAVSYCLADLLLLRFAKIPFTCSYSAWQQGATAMAVIYAFGLFVFASIIPGIEHDLLRRGPIGVIGFACLILGGWLWFRRWTVEEFSQGQVLFEDEPAPVLSTLNLSGG